MSAPAPLLFAVPRQIDRIYEAAPAHSEPAIAHAEAVRTHIQEAIRIQARHNVSLNAYASDDQFEQPNAATETIYVLGLALEALKSLAGGGS